MQLVDYIRGRRRERDLLIMTHIVLGYPDMKTCLELVDAMVGAGVDLMELQIPFSEPLADGPVIASACQQALAIGVTVDDCLELAEQVTRRHPIPFLFVSYFNVLCKRGLERFVDDAREAGIAGAIVPDCPLEESAEYVAAMRRSALAPVFLVSPRSPEERLRLLGSAGEGLVYAVARTGVTGASTELSTELERYLERCRRSTELPLAVGFGIRSPADVRLLVGKADIAVIGSQTLTLLDHRSDAERRHDASCSRSVPDGHLCTGGTSSTLGETRRGSSDRQRVSPTGLERVANFLAELGGPAARLPWRAPAAHPAPALR